MSDRFPPRNPMRRKATIIRPKLKADPVKEWWHGYWTGVFTVGSVAALVFVTVIK